MYIFERVPQAGPPLAIRRVCIARRALPSGAPKIMLINKLLHYKIYYLVMNRPTVFLSKSLNSGKLHVFLNI